MSGAGAEVDSSVCYRHPGRTSWTLCERCGRTICPECQILTPQGVRCPTCIEELGGSVQWTPTAAPRPRPVKARRPRARWQQIALDLLAPGSGAPVLSWGAGILALGLWIIGFFTAVPATWLAVIPTAPLWQIWRFVTTSFVYPPGLGSVLSLLFGILFLVLNAPMIERSLGRRRFVTLFLAAGAVGSAWMAIAGLGEYGLFTPLFGLLGCYLVLAWSMPRARFQMLIMLGILVVLNLLLSPFEILAMVGAFGTGVGVMQLFRVFDERTGSRPSTPYLIVAGGAVLFVAIAIIRQLVVG